MLVGVMDGENCAVLLGALTPKMLWLVGCFDSLGCFDCLRKKIPRRRCEFFFSYMVRSLFDSEIFAIHNPDQDECPPLGPKSYLYDYSYALLVVNLKIYKDLMFLPRLLWSRRVTAPGFGIVFFFRWAKEASDHVRKKYSRRRYARLYGT